MTDIPLSVVTNEVARLTRKVGGPYQRRDRGSVPCRRNLHLVAVPVRHLRHTALDVRKGLRRAAYL